MQATTTPLAALLTFPERFVAPLYQRPYVWERERNWEPFWETVIDVADHYVRGEAVRPRFLGAIVLEQLLGPVGQVTMRQIIDGQQRLTTVQIMLAAARDVCATRCEERGWNDQFVQQFAQLTANFPPFQLPEEQFKVWPTNADREPFQRVMTSGSPTKLAIAGGSPAAWQEGTKNKPLNFTLGKSSDAAVQRVLDLCDAWSEEEWGAEERQLTNAQWREVRSQFKKYADPENDHLMVRAYWFFWSSLAQWLDADAGDEPFQILKDKLSSTRAFRLC